MGHPSTNPSVGKETYLSGISLVKLDSGRCCLYNMYTIIITIFVSTVIAMIMVQGQGVRSYRVQSVPPSCPLLSVSLALSVSPSPSPSPSSSVSLPLRFPSLSLSVSPSLAFCIGRRLLRCRKSSAALMKIARKTKLMMRMMLSSSESHPQTARCRTLALNATPSA